MRRVVWVLPLVLTCVSGSCTSPAIRAAMKASKRSDEVRTAVVENQHRNLLRLWKAATWNALTTTRPVTMVLPDGNSRTLGQYELFEMACSDRDLIEGLYISDTWGRAIQIAAVDTVLANEQSKWELLLGRQIAEPIMEAARKAGVTSKPAIVTTKPAVATTGPSKQRRDG